MHSNGKLWAAVFALVAIACSVAYWWGPAHDMWLPPDHSTYGIKTDNLFNMILAITSVAFVGVQIALCSFMWKYGNDGSRARGTFVHGNHQLEVAWTVIPAAILVLIAVVQWSTWLEIKRPANFPEKVAKQVEEKRPFAEVLAGQFEWRITYPRHPGSEGPDGKIGARDDVHVLNNFHVPQGEYILIHLRSRDVLHSFYLPNFRLKQDAVPGMTIPVWFMAKGPKEGDATCPPDKDSVRFDLMCAELCGWGHYKMKGALTVHRDRASFDKWLDEAKKAEEATQ
ncbi:MAG TPA: cytochrome c oxidase subunit II [Planctomycetota bacterium]|nr:cytochrome c oxidase subunit II [Planctomycetota bacterium]